MSLRRVFAGLFVSFASANGSSQVETGFRSGEAGKSRLSDDGRLGKHSPSIRCCKTQTAKCMACLAGQSVEEFCAANQWATGCPLVAKDGPCCIDNTAECLACNAKQTVEEYCVGVKKPLQIGCPPATFTCERKLCGWSCVDREIAGICDIDGVCETRARVFERAGFCAMSPKLGSPNDSLVVNQSGMQSHDLLASAGESSRLASLGKFCALLNF